MTVGSGDSVGGTDVEVGAGNAVVHAVISMKIIGRNNSLFMGFPSQNKARPQMKSGFDTSEMIHRKYASL